MRKLCSASIVFFLFIAFPFLSQGSSGPKLVIEEKEFSFSEVQEGKVIEHAFRVFNKGDQPLLIQRVNPG